MSEFLHEGGASDKAKLPKRREKKLKSKTAQRAPMPAVGRKQAAAPRKPGRFDSALSSLMQDFKAGVSRFSGLTD